MDVRLVLVCVLFALPFAAAANCNGSVNANLVLAGNVNAIGNTTCFNVTASYVTIDCAGFRVFSNKAGTGFNASNVLNFTLKNCVVTNFSTGVLLNNSNFSTVFNNVVWNNSGYGLNDQSSLGSNYSYDNFSHNGYHGVLLAGIVANLNFSHNTVYGNGPTANYRGVEGLNGVVNSSTFFDNNASYNGGHGLAVCGNYNNFSYNNASYNSQRPGNPDTYAGIYVGWYPAGVGSRVHNNIISFQGYGLYIDSQIGLRAEFNTFEGNSNLAVQATWVSNSTVIFNNTFLNSKAADVMLYQGNHHNVSYNYFFNNSRPVSTAYLLFDSSAATEAPSEGSALWIAYNVVRGGGYEVAGFIGMLFGFSGGSVSNSTVFANTVYGHTGAGVEIRLGSGNNVSYNNFSYNAGYQVYLSGAAVASVSGNTIQGNTLIGDYGLNASSSSSSNTVYGNGFYGGANVFVNNSNSTNEFNTTVAGKYQGNYYADILDYAVYDLDGDGYGDAGAGYPYAAASSGKWLGLGGDYGPRLARYSAPVCSSPVVGAVLSPGGTVALQGYCESNAVVANASFWVFKNSGFYGVYPNSSVVLNATVFGVDVGLPVEAAAFAWMLECRDNYSRSFNSTQRSFSTSEPGSSGGASWSSPSPSVGPTPVASAVPVEPQGGGGGVVASPSPSIGPSPTVSPVASVVPSFVPGVSPLPSVRVYEPAMQTPGFRVPVVSDVVDFVYGFFAWVWRSLFS
jgi:hypothetical protein